MPKEKTLSLRDHRRRALLTGPQAAARLRVHPNTIYGWETHRCRPTPAQVARLARLYKISGEDVLAGIRKPL